NPTPQPLHTKYISQAPFAARRYSRLGLSNYLVNELFVGSTVVYFVVSNPPVLGRESDTKLTVELAFFNFIYEVTEQSQKIVLFSFLHRILWYCIRLVHLTGS